MSRPAIIVSLCLIPLLLHCSSSRNALDPGDAGSGGRMATSDGQAASPDTQEANPPVGGAGGFSCDQRKVVCKRVAPVCPFEQAPAVVDGCYGDCVSIHTCACESAADCPDQNQYTCFRNSKRCGPFIY